MFSQVKHFKKPDHLYKERKLTTDPKVMSVPFCLLSEVGHFNMRAWITFEASSGLHQVHFLALPHWLHFSAPEVAAWRRQAEHPRCSWHILLISVCLTGELLSFEFKLKEKRRFFYEVRDFVICAAKLGILLSVLSLGFNTLDTNQTNRPFWTTKPPTAGMVYYCRRRAPFGCNTTPTVASSVPTTTLSPSPDSPPHLHSLSFYLPLLPHLCALTNWRPWGLLQVTSDLTIIAVVNCQQEPKHTWRCWKSIFFLLWYPFLSVTHFPLPYLHPLNPLHLQKHHLVFFCTVCNPEKPQFRTQLIFGLIGPWWYWPDTTCSPHLSACPCSRRPYVHKFNTHMYSKWHWIHPENYLIYLLPWSFWPCEGGTHP